MKTKRKRQVKFDLKNWLVELFRPVPFDFIAYLPVEECAARLASREKRSWWRLTKTAIAVTPIDDSSHAFHVKHVRHTYGLIIEARGHFQRNEGNPTSVEGEIIAQSNLYPTIVFLLAIIIGMYFITYSGRYLLLPLTVVWIIGAMFYLFLERKCCHELAEMIETTLGY